MTYGIVIAVLVLALIAVLIAVIVQTNSDVAPATDSSGDHDEFPAPNESVPAQAEQQESHISMTADDFTMAQMASAAELERLVEPETSTVIDTIPSEEGIQTRDASEYAGRSEETDRDPGPVGL